MSKDTLGLPASASSTLTKVEKYADCIYQHGLDDQAGSAPQPALLQPLGPCVVLDTLGAAGTSNDLSGFIDSDLEDWLGTTKVTRSEDVEDAAAKAVTTTATAPPSFDCTPVAVARPQPVARSSDVGHHTGARPLATRTLATPALTPPFHSLPSTIATISCNCSLTDGDGDSSRTFPLSPAESRGLRMNIRGDAPSIVVKLLMPAASDAQVSEQAEKLKEMVHGRPVIEAMLQLDRETLADELKKVQINPFLLGALQKWRHMRPEEYVFRPGMETTQLHEAIETLMKIWLESQEAGMQCLPAAAPFYIKVTNVYLRADGLKLMELPQDQQSQWWRCARDEHGKCACPPREGCDAKRQLVYELRRALGQLLAGSNIDDKDLEGWFELEKVRSFCRTAPNPLARVNRCVGT